MAWNKADARLIATAPDLLAVLRAYRADHDRAIADRAAQAVGHPTPAGVCACALCHDARTTIAKAEGQ